ncbi:MAG: phosphoglucosamine mutase [Pseudomonadota bacterium]
MTRKYFGTDGIRGRVGDGVMTPEFVLKLGWAAGRVLCSNNGNLVLIGKDTRISGYMLESVLEAGLSAAGVNTRLLGPMPTPGIAYLTRTLRASAGIVISASHNPYYDNGVKFFSTDGAKLPDEIEQQIEAELDKPLTTVSSDLLGKAERVTDAAGRYIEFCKSTIASRIRLNGLKVVVDCAHGATYHVAPNVFRELGAEVISIGSEPNGLNINEECGATNPKQLRMAVIEHQANLGIAIDGDGDRLIMVDKNGEVVDGDELLYIIAVDRKQKEKLPGGVVGTLMSNLGLEHALKRQNIPFQRAPVGDRYVLEKLKESNWVLGGESSGHIICLDRTTTGDAIVSALQVLAVLVEQGIEIGDAKQDMTKYPQTLVNVPVDKKIDLESSQGIKQAVSEAEGQLAESGRVLLRPSGTEPLIRVMVEGMDGPQVKTLAENIASVVSQECAA